VTGTTIPSQEDLAVSNLAGTRNHRHKTVLSQHLETPVLLKEFKLKEITFHVQIQQSTLTENIHWLILLTLIDQTVADGLLFSE